MSAERLVTIVLASDFVDASTTAVGGPNAAQRLSFDVARA